MHSNKDANVSRSGKLCEQCLIFHASIPAGSFDTGYHSASGSDHCSSTEAKAWLANTAIIMTILYAKTFCLTRLIHQSDTASLSASPSAEKTRVNPSRLIDCRPWLHGHCHCLALAKALASLKEMLSLSRNAGLSHISLAQIESNYHAIRQTTYSVVSQLVDIKEVRVVPVSHLSLVDFTNVA